MDNNQFKYAIKVNFNLENPVGNTNIPTYEFAKNLYYILNQAKTEQSQKDLNEIINTYIILNKKRGEYVLSFKNIPDNILNAVNEKAMPIRQKLALNQEKSIKKISNKNKINSEKIAEQFINKLEKIN